MQENSFNDKGTLQNEADKATRLFKEWLEQKRAEEPEKLFDEAFVFACSEIRRLERNERMEFLLNVWLYSFREKLRSLPDDELAETRASDVWDTYVKLFVKLCSDKNLTLSLDERNNLERRLDVERRARVDKPSLLEDSVKIVSNDYRGLSSLGNLKDTKTTIQTQFEISESITAPRLTSIKNDESNEQAQTRGGQKDVFRGRQVQTRQNVAVKTSKGGYNDTAMIREAKFQARIGHQGVPTVISLNETGVPVIVEPYIDGTSWEAIINQKVAEENQTSEEKKLKSQTTEEKLDTLIQVGMIMNYVHRVSKIVHGDIKPDNVMIGNYGEVYVIDWGAAIDLNDSAEKKIINVGTEKYRAPETCAPKGCYGLQEPASPATDVYMLGGILCQIVVPSHKTFNETLLDWSNYEVSQWKNRNKFPKFLNVSEEMCEVLQKALAYKPEDRYQDAGEFVDALKNCQKKRRFNDNRKSFEQWKEQAEGAQIPRKGKEQQEKATKITNGLITCVNVFALIREEMENNRNERKQDETKEWLKDLLQDEFYVDVLKEELQSRSFLLECSINAQDYGQADALAGTQDEVLGQYQGIDQVPDFGINADLQAQRKRIARGYLGRTINRALIFLLGVVVVFALVTLGVAVHKEKQRVKAEQQVVAEKEQTAQANAQRAQAEQERAETEAKARKASNQQLLDIYKRNALTAQNDKFGQGEITFWAKALDIIDPTTKKRYFPQGYNLLDIASRTSILPQKIASFNRRVETAVFSSDGRYFMFQDDQGNFNIWDAEKMQVVSKVNLSLPEKIQKDGFATPAQNYVYANPFFEDETNADPVLSSRFLLFNTGGDIWLISNRQETKLATFLSNVRIEADEVKKSGKSDPNTLIMNGDEFKKNLDVSFDKLEFSACYVTEKDVTGRALLSVGTVKGEVLTYSLPDCKLVGSFKTQNSIVGLETSIQKKYFVIVDKDGQTCRRYSFDGKMLNEYDFDFPEINLSESDRLVRSPRLNFALSPLGNKFVIGNDLGNIRVWNVDTDKLIAKAHDVPEEEGVYKSEISRFYWLDEERFLSLSEKSDCRLWNLNEIESDGILKSIPVDCGASTSESILLRTAIFSSVSKKLVYAGNDDIIRMVDVDKRELFAQTKGSFAEFSSYSDCAYLPGKNVLILGNLTKPFDMIELFDAQSLSKIRSISLSRGELPGVDMFPYPKFTKSIAVPDVGSEFAVALTTGKIVFIDLDNAGNMRSIDDFCQGMDKYLFTPRFEDYIMIAADSKARRLVGTTKEGKEIICWDWENKTPPRRWNKSSSDKELVERRTFELCFVDDDKILEITDTGLLILWDASTGTQILSNQIPSNSIESWTQDIKYCSLSHNRKIIALGRRDGSILLVSTENLEPLIGESIHKLSNQSSKIYEEDEYNNDTVDDDMWLISVTGAGWSKDDSMLCVSYADDSVALFDVDLENKFVAVRSSFITDLSNSSATPFFIADNRLVTLCKNGTIQFWDYEPSQELATTLWNGDVKKTGLGDSRQQEWAVISPSETLKENFAVFSGTNLKYKASDVGDFQYWKNPGGTSGFLTLRMTDGKLVFLDGTSYQPVPCVIDERQGSPQEGFERFCTSPDGTVIVGTERISNKPWILDLSQPDSQWEQIKWDNTGARSLQLTFSPNSRILASGDYSLINLWDLKTSSELLKRDGNEFEGVVTSEGGSGKPITDYGEICFISDNLVVQTGKSECINILDVRKRSWFQKVSVPLIGKAQVIRTCESLNKGIGKDKPISFIVGGDDGILRFYQLSPITNQFEPIYVISHLQLASPGDSNEGESVQNEELSNEHSLDASGDAVRSISLSDDGKILYVGLSGGVCSYNMEEIWNNIENLSHKRSNVDIEDLTGVRYHPSGILTPFIPDRMTRVNKE